MSKSAPTILQPNEGKKLRIFGGIEFTVAKRVGRSEVGPSQIAHALVDAWQKG